MKKEEIMEAQKHLDFWQKHFNIKIGCRNEEHIMEQKIKEDDVYGLHIACDKCHSTSIISDATIKMLKDYYEENKDKKKPRTLDWEGPEK